MIAAYFTGLVVMAVLLLAVDKYVGGPDVDRFKLKDFILLSVLWPATLVLFLILFAVEYAMIYKASRAQRRRQQRS